MKVFRNAALLALMSIWLVPSANAVPVEFDIVDSLAGSPSGDEDDDIVISGFVSVDAQEFDDFGPGQSGFFVAFASFDLGVSLPIPNGNSSTRVTIPVTPDTAILSLNRQATRIDANAIIFDATGLPPFTPLFDIQVDKFLDEAGQPTEIGFPDGRRLGDDVTDLLIVQIFSGSVNLGIAALTSGVSAPPSLVQTVELTPGNEFTLATAAGANTPVPAPPMLPIFAGALAFIAWRSRRNPPAKG